jgi:TM2 domain-containing membrane protein YozV
MNCATHNTVEAVAYCRTCGKALCAACTRPVRGVIYCENCLAARLEGVQPPANTAVGFVAPAAGGGPVQPASGPNPALAGILSGFFPFGVGAVYTGQYAKGLAHLIIFFLLVWGTGHISGLICGLGIAFFYVYQIIDAVRSAKAIQMGQPAPDPFGLGQTFSTGQQKTDMAKIPTGAIVLIGLGVLFMLHTMGMLEFGVDRVWPFFLLFLGFWMFAQRWGLLGRGTSSCQCPRCRARCLMGPAVLVTIGVLGLLDSMGHVGWGRTWPVILLVIGLVKLQASNASTDGHIDVPPAQISRGPVTPQPPIQPPSSEVPHV